MGDRSVIIIDKAIRTTHSDVVSVSIQDENNYSARDADDNEITLDTSAIQAEITRLQAEYDSKQYARDRATQYAPLADQLDMLWHAIDQGIDLKQSDFYTGNKAVKDAHPKG